MSAVRKLLRHLEEEIKDHERRGLRYQHEFETDEPPPPMTNDQAIGLARAAGAVLAWTLGQRSGPARVEEAYKRLVGWKPGWFPLDHLTDDDTNLDELTKCPFFSESYLYELMGKEDARTVLALIATLAEAAGIPRLDQHRLAVEAYKEDSDE